MKIIVAIIIILSLILSSIIVFAQELPEDPLVISVEFSGTTIPKLDYRFNRDKEYWEFRGFGEWIPVTDIGEPGAPFNGQHIRLATNLIILDEERGYQLFDDLSSGKLNLGSDSVLVLGLPPPENAQGEGIAPITPGVASAAISGGQSCISPRCQQIDQVWINIRGLMSGIAAEAKNSVYDPATKNWISSAVGTTPEQKPSGDGETVPVDVSTRPTDPNQRLLWIYNTYKNYIDGAANEFNVDWSLIVAVIDVESKGDPRAVSCTGAAGLMQFIVSTAQGFGLQTTGNNPVVHDIQCDNRNWETSRVCRKNNLNACDFFNDDRFNPELNIRTGARYIRQLLDQQDNNLEQALLRYSGNNPAYYDAVLQRKEKVEALH